MLYIGLDVHSRQSSLCILNAQGGTVNQIQVKGPRSQVVDRLRHLDQPFSICYEASCGYGHLYEQLRPLATMHRMIKVMGAMMRTGTAYDANYKR